MNTTEETIETLFKQFADVERVKKIKDYCFVHFSTREGARNALDQMQGKVQISFVCFLNVIGFQTQRCFLSTSIYLLT